MADNPNNCSTCGHKQTPDGGWCYMFRDEPKEICRQHTANKDFGKQLNESFAKVFGAPLRG